VTNGTSDVGSFTNHMPILTEAERLGTTLDGRYVLRSVLGRGGMGVVYAAEHALTGRSVAVKLVRPELADDPRYAERLFREARAAASLQHPNVVDVLDMGALEDGGLYLVLERLEGFDLATVLDVEGPLSVQRVLRVIDPVLDALEALHAKGIVHRDLKPSNVFLTRRGVVEVPKLLDFGIAKLRDGHGSTTTGRILGTPWYMSPEQAAGDVEAGPEVDVWAVGAMIFECLTGRVPFDGPTPTAVLMNVLRHDAPRLELPEAPHVAEAVRRAMSKGDDRIRSAAGLREALRGSVEVGETDVEADVRRGSRAARRATDDQVTRNLARPAVPSRSRRGSVVATAVLALAAAATIGWAVLRGDDERTPPAVFEREAVRDVRASDTTRADDARPEVAPLTDDVPTDDGAGSSASPAPPPVSPPPPAASPSSPPQPRGDASHRVGRTSRRVGPARDDEPPAPVALPTNVPSSSDPARALRPIESPIEGPTEARPSEPSLRTRW